MISECEYSSCSCMLSKSKSLSSSFQHHLCNRRINKKQSVFTRDISFQNHGYFHSGISHIWGVLINVTCSRVIFFGINGLFHFGIFCFGGAMIFHVTYLSCLSMSNMSLILLLPTGDLVCVPLVLFGFSFLVVVEIGSLARFMCFSNVDLS